MSGISVISGLVRCFVARFGPASIPKEDVLTINSFSEIPAKLQKLREFKYGPKIKLADGKLGVITTKYMAGFSGSPPYGYAESLFMEFGNKITSHEQIREEMDKLRKSHPKDSLICALQDAASAQATSIVDSNVDFCLEKIERPPWMTLSEVFRGLQFKVIQHMAPTIRNWMIYAGKITEDALEGFMWTGKRDCELSKVIGSRILTIWFIAEAFRYPPMMFYSLILLHLFVNHFLSDDEFEEALHPSEGKTEKAQYFLYVKESDNTHPCSDKKGYIEANRNQFDKTIKGMEEKKRLVLRKLFNGIYNNFQKLGYPEDKCNDYSKIVFKTCISKYLKICIGEKGLKEHPVDIEALLKLSSGPV